MQLDPSFVQTWSPRALAVLRIVTAYLFLQHGTAKVFHIPHVAMFDNLRLMSLFGLVGVLEVVGGLLVLIGLFTRPAAFVLSGQTAFAYFIGHASKGNPLSPMPNQGESAVLAAGLRTPTIAGPARARTARGRAPAPAAA